MTAAQGVMMPDRVPQIGMKRHVRGLTVGVIEHGPAIRRESAGPPRRADGLPDAASYYWLRRLQSEGATS